MLSAVVLAGGMATRMGLDKGLMVIGQKPMFLHVVDAVSALTRDIVVSAGHGRCREYETLARGYKVVEDRRAGLGPLEGLSNGLRQVRGDYAIVVPCDTPLVRAELLRLLACRADGRDGAVPIVGGHLEPLVAVYRRTCADRFEHELGLGVRRVGAALEGLDLCLLSEEELRGADPDLQSLMNVNSPEDLDHIRTLLE